MSEQIDDGGPAFPKTMSTDGMGRPDRLINGYGHIESVGGMTLRDWFAGQALAGMVQHGSGYPARLARSAYEVADAMIAARKAKE